MRLNVCLFCYEIRFDSFLIFFICFVLLFFPCLRIVVGFFCAFSIHYWSCFFLFVCLCPFVVFVLLLCKCLCRFCCFCSSFVCVFVSHKIQQKNPFLVFCFFCLFCCFCFFPLLSCFPVVQAYLYLAAGSYRLSLQAVALHTFAKEITAGRDMITDVTSLWVLLDPTLLGLIFDNVISNAFNHGHPSHPQVEAAGGLGQAGVGGGLRRVHAGVRQPRAKGKSGVQLRGRGRLSFQPSVNSVVIDSKIQ